MRYMVYGVWSNFKPSYMHKLVTSFPLCKTIEGSSNLKSHCVILINVRDSMQVPNVTVPVLVNPCSNGSVLQGDICTYCTAPQYSFNPLGSDQSGQCDEPCPINAQCLGGAVMVPEAGFWMSSPFSDSIVTCPYSAACAGSNDALITCLQAGNQSAISLPQVGHLHMHWHQKA